MKKTFLLICCHVILSVCAQAQQRFDVKMKVDGVAREFIVVRPSGAPPAGGYPVVFMFHGTSGDGEKFYDISGWKEKGEAEKIITVFPSSLRYCVLGGETDNTPIKITKWNNGDLQDSKCPDVTQDFKDDVKFVRMMADTIRKTFPVHPGKIYASGFSNGSVMAFKLALEASDLFAAAAGSGGSFNALDSITPKRRIPVMQMLGSRDDRYTTPHNVEELPFGGDSILAYMSRPIRRALSCESLTESYTKSNTARTNAFIFETPKPGFGPNRYVFVLLDNMYHVFPNGSNYPLVAADIFWEFFKQAPVTTSAAHTAPQTVESLVAYPNPSSGDMRFETAAFAEGAPFDVAVFDLFGRQVFAAARQTGDIFTLQKQDTGSGVFIARLRSGHKTAVKKIVFD